jgi:hypothetical protein
MGLVTILPLVDNQMTLCAYPDGETRQLLIAQRSRIDHDGNSVRVTPPMAPGRSEFFRKHCHFSMLIHPDLGNGNTSKFDFHQATTWLDI